MYGAWVIDSLPPATTMSASPAWIIWSARWIVLTPERHTLLMVVAGTVMGMPALTAAWREAIWPAPAWSTWPMNTYSTCSAERPARSSAALMARPPSSAAEKPARAPDHLPLGGRARARNPEPAQWDHPT